MLKKHILYILSLSFILIGCSTKQNQPIRVQKGKLNLSNYNFQENEPIKLNGLWIFEHSDSKNPSFIEVPMPWEKKFNSAIGNYGTYFLEIKLDNNFSKNQLGLYIGGINGAYQLKINNSMLKEVGKIQPTIELSYSNQLILVPQTDSILKIEITVANDKHHKSGIIESISLGDYQRMKAHATQINIVGGCLMGVCCAIGIFFLTLYFKLSNKKYLLNFGLFSLTLLIHISCLVNRIFYKVLGDKNWIWSYKTELSTIFLGLFFLHQFYKSYYYSTKNNKLDRIFSFLYLLAFLFIWILPTPYFTYFDLVVPFGFLIFALFLLLLLYYLIQEKNDDAVFVSIVNFIVISSFFRHDFMFNQDVQSIEAIHLLVISYLICISFILIKKIKNVFLNEEKLKESLVLKNKELEKQNENLAQIVEERTQQLLEVEKRAHQMELEQKNKDLDFLMANNQLKVQFNKNLIESLEELPKNEKELKGAISSLISNLKSQINLEDKIEILQHDLELVNSDFYMRLKEKFPKLSKTEREICAFIKLNLSNKEIAELRKTSVSTINVTRSRLRKKLDLGRDIELESFIQSF